MLFQTFEALSTPETTLLPRFSLLRLPPLPTPPLQTSHFSFSHLPTLPHTSLCSLAFHRHEH